MPRSCPYVLFSHYSHIHAFCPFIALNSPLIFLQQRLLESLIRPRNEVHCSFVSSLFFDLFGTQTLQEPLFSLYVYSLLHVPPFLILFSFLIRFVLDPWLGLCCLSWRIVTAFCWWFDIPSLLAIPLFHSLYDVCIVCYTFNIYLTTLFDVYCMLFQSIHCMRNLPMYTKRTLHLASHLYHFV
jgi:hypothetical protein